MRHAGVVFSLPLVIMTHEPARSSFHELRATSLGLQKCADTFYDCYTNHYREDEGGGDSDQQSSTATGVKEDSSTGSTALHNKMSEVRPMASPGPYQLQTFYQNERIKLMNFLLEGCGRLIRNKICADDSEPGCSCSFCIENTYLKLAVNPLNMVSNSADSTISYTVSVYSALHLCDRDFIH